MPHHSVPARTTCPACKKVVQFSSSDLMRNSNIIVSCPGCGHEFPLSLRSGTIPRSGEKKQPATAKVRPATRPFDEPPLVEPIPSSTRSEADHPPKRTRRAAAAPVREDLPLPVSPAPPFVTLESDSSTSHIGSQSLPPFAPSGAGRTGSSDTPAPPPIPAAAPTFAPAAKPRRSWKERWNSLSSSQQTWLVAIPLIVLVGVLVIFLPFGGSGAPPQKGKRGDPESNKAQPEPDKTAASEKKDGPPPVPLLLDDPSGAGEKKPGSEEKAPSVPKEIPAPEPGKTPKPDGEESTLAPPPR